MHRISKRFFQFLIFFFVLCEIYITWKGIRVIGWRNINLVYVFIPLMCIALSVYILKVKEEIRSNLLLVCVSIGVGVYLMEAMSPGIDSLKKMYSKDADTKNNNLDHRPRWKIIEELKEKGISAKPFVFWIDGKADQIDEYDSILPVAHMSGTTIAFCSECDDFVIYDGDEHGFNNPTGLYGRKGTDFVLVGDSFTHGACVKPENNIRGQLASLGMDGFNLGYSGNGPLFNLATVVEYAKAIQPKHVFWLHTESNDLKKDLEEEKRNPILLKYLNYDFSQDLINRQEEIDSQIAQFYERILKKTATSIPFNEKTEKHIPWYDAKFVRFIKLDTLRDRLGISGLSKPGNSLFYSPDLYFFKRILHKANTTVSGFGGRFYFVYLPDWINYHNSSKAEKLFYRKQVLGIVESLNIPIIDIHDTFSNATDPLSFFPCRQHGHYTSDGYKVVAKAIMENIKKEHKE